MKDLVESGLGKFRVTSGPLASTNEEGNSGAFRLRYNRGTVLFCISSDGMDWEHVSVSVTYTNKRGKTVGRIPTWVEMCAVKELFFQPGETVIQYHPAENDYVNNHPHCLHLWRPISQEIPKPPPAMVGIKSLGELIPVSKQP